MLFGALPALRATRLDLIAVIKENARSGLPRFGLTGGQAMVAAQTALAIFLLVGAGLFMRTLTNLRSADLGFRADGLLYASIEPRSGGLVQAQRQQFFEDAVARLRALPGVTSAAASAVAPMGGDMSVGIGNFSIPICPPAATPPGDRSRSWSLSTASRRDTSPTMDVPIVEGRDFHAQRQRPVTAPRLARRPSADRERGIRARVLSGTVSGRAGRQPAEPTARSLSAISQIVGVVRRQPRRSSRRRRADGVLSARGLPGTGDADRAHAPAIRRR